MGKKTLVMGASPNPERYSYKATVKLRKYGHQVLPHGIRKGDIEGLPILNNFPSDKDIDTVTLYLNPGNQEQYYSAILNLKPRRIIFNPGTENPELEALAALKGIETVEACTLVMLSTNRY